MARALIVGCGCRGRALSAALIAAGHSARGTTRDPARLEAIAATGAEAVVADPDRLGTLTPQLEEVSVLCWLMGAAAGPPQAIAALHGPRLESILGAIVDSPVRGVVYEATGTVDPALLAEGTGAVRRAAETHRIPVALIESEPASHAEWLEAATAAVRQVLRG
jgi:Trk K+ transport system NAD-binding subunit